jgi:hypothetical protein
MLVNASLSLPVPLRRVAPRLGWPRPTAPAPRLALAPAVRPQCRLEMALCALFRCQREWTVPELVARLALAPSGSDRPDGRTTAGAGELPACLGQSAAARAVERCVAQGLLVIRLSD